MARDAFATFIPISIGSDARTKIIFDFFDLLAAIAAHGKTNGLGGRKLSRLAGWWAFEHSDTGNGFEGGYKSWLRYDGPAVSLQTELIYPNSAADATSHLFFAYLRSLSPDGTSSLDMALPRSLQTLVQSTEYPPERPTLMQSVTTKVVMIVNAVSPTPFALLRRAKHFEYRDDDRALQQFSEYDDPVQALTDECRRVLKSISSVNDSSISTNASTTLKDTSWSRFEDLGFGGLSDDFNGDDGLEESALGKKRQPPQGLRTTPHSKNDLGRPTTPSWADFLSTGFVEDSAKSSSFLPLPPDKQLPPINPRGQSSQSHVRPADNEDSLEPGELASIVTLDLDDAFWWTWINSLAGEEPIERKSVFGRCALIETRIKGGKWLILEEMVKGAAPEPEAGAYIVEKKSRFGFSRKNRLGRSKSSRNQPPAPKHEPYLQQTRTAPVSKVNIAPDQHARIQAAAAALQRKQNLEETHDVVASSPRRARGGDAVSTKTNSVFTLQPMILSEAAPAMKWAHSYDKNAIRAKYLGTNFSSKSNTDLLTPNGNVDDAGDVTPKASEKPVQGAARSQSYGFPPQGEPETMRSKSYGFPDQNKDGRQSTTTVGKLYPEQPQDLPPLPPSTTQTPGASYEPPVATPAAPPLPPPAPPKITEAAEDSAFEASVLPLPATTPMEYPRPMERQEKPTVEQEAHETTPKKQNLAEFIASESTKTDHEEPVLNGVPSQSTSPESQKSQGKKLKKSRDQRTGLKGLFSRKKAEPPTQQASPTSSPSNSQAIAAARAALSGPPKQPGSQTRVDPVKDQSSLGRRFSGIGRKKSPHVAPVATPPQVATTMEEMDEDPPVSSAEPTPVPSPRFKPPHFGGQESTASIPMSHTETEEEYAGKEFSSFDQGAHHEQRHLDEFDNRGRPHSEYTDSVVTEPVESQPMQEQATNPSKPVDDASSAVSDEAAHDTSPAKDRWAQIRKNAAERAAVRQSEDQTRPSMTEKTDDDGETSGEESKSYTSSIF